MNYLKKLNKYMLSKYKIIVIFLLLLNFFLISSSVYNENIIWDEICYVGMGKYIVETGNFKTDGSIFHAPLSYYINSLFLYPIKIPQSTLDLESCWDRGPKILFGSKNPIFLLFLIRLPLILLSVLLGFYVFKWAKELYGINAGLFALFFYSLSPNIISTAKFALTDFSLVCFAFISMYYFWKFCERSTAWNLIILGFVTGLALISKITALFLVPIYIVLGLIFIKRIFSERIINLVLVFLMAFFIVFAAYGFKIQTISNTLPDHYSDRAHEEIDNRLQDGNVKNLALFVFDKIPIPAATYFTVIGDVAYYSTKGFNGYFFGKIIEVGNKPFYYFPGVIILKTPIPTLIFLLLSIIFFKKCRHKKIRNEIFILVPIFLFLVTFLLNEISYDLRHILTIYPFLFLFMSKVVNLNFKWKKVWKLFFFLLLIWYAISTLLIFPFYTAYFNEFVHPKDGYKYLSGTNLDSGQDLLRLKDFMEENNIDKINFSYHGAIDPLNYGIDYDYMPNVCFSPINKYYEPFAANCDGEIIEDCSKRTGMVAISVTNLQNRFLDNSSCFDWLLDYEPIDRLGYSIFVYNITN